MHGFRVVFFVFVASSSRGRLRSTERAIDCAIGRSIVPGRVANEGRVNLNADLDAMPTLKAEMLLPRSLIALPLLMRK